MTILIGVLCREGVVIGADSSATFGAAGGIRTIEQPCHKLEIVNKTIVVAGTGQVGLGQRFVERVKEAWEQKYFRDSPVDAARKLAELAIKDFISTKAPAGSYGALVAFPISDKLHLCEFQIADFQPELKVDPIWFCSMGSGQLIGDPFMALMREIFWEKGPPSLQDGIFAAVWALEHAVSVNAGGVNGPIEIAVLRREGGRTVASLLADDDLQEHREAIQEAKERLRDLRRNHRGDGAEVPEVPRPAK